jgi:hypothetical protein
LYRQQLQLCAPCNTPATPPSFDNALQALAKLACSGGNGGIHTSAATTGTLVAHGTQSSYFAQTMITTPAQNNNHNTTGANSLHNTRDRCACDARTNITPGTGTRRPWTIVTWMTWTAAWPVTQGSSRPTQPVFKVHAYKSTQT